MKKIITFKVTFTALLIALVLVNTCNINVISASKKEESKAKDTKNTRLLGAEDLVNALFTDSSHTQIIPGLTQTTIDTATAVVQLLFPSPLKTELLELLDTASGLLNAATEAEDAAKNAVNALFTDGTHSQIKQGLVQADIDVALSLADGLDNEVLKLELKVLISTSQLLLDNDEDEEAQNQAAQAAVDGLFTDETHTMIKNGLKQVDITGARALVAILSDPTLKITLNNLIDEAQDQLDVIIANEENAKQVVKDAVDGLFTDETHTVIKSDLTQQNVDEAKALVDALNDPVLKASLTIEINIAQLLYDAVETAEEAVNALLDGTHTALKDGVVQESIDAAMLLVNVLPSSPAKTALLDLLQIAQNLLDDKDEVEAAQAAVDGLFSDNTHTALKDGVTQTDIDDAKTLVDALDNSSEKTAMLALVAIAQELKDNATVLSAAQAAVDSLFTDETHTALKDGVTQTNIDDAKALVNALPDSSAKTAMLDLLTTAQELKDNNAEITAAQAAVDALFTDGTHTALKDGVDQAAIDAAKALVNALNDSPIKTAMLDLLTTAQELNDSGAEISAAQAAVDALFTDGTHTALKDGVDQAAIDAAKALVNALNDSPIKTAMLDLLTTAQELNDSGAEISAAQAAVDALFTDGTHTALKDGVDQAAIDAAKALVNALNDSPIKTAMLDLLTTAQELNDSGAEISAAQAAVDALFTDGTHTALKDGVDQAAIDAAKALVNALSDSPIKTAMLDLLTDAQDLRDVSEKLLEAKAAVDALFTDGTHTVLKDSVTQETIDAAKALVNALNDSTIKVSLQAFLTTAQDQFDENVKIKAAQDTVNALFTDGTHTVLKDGVKQTDIDAAKAKVNALKNSQTKTDLLALITKAQLLFDKKNPNTPPIKVGTISTVKIKGVTYYYKYLSNKKWWNFKSVSSNTVRDNYYASNKCKSNNKAGMNCATLKQITTKVIKNKVTLKTTVKKYNQKTKNTKTTVVQRNSKKRNVLVYNKMTSYFKNQTARKQVTLYKKRLSTNKYTVRYKTTYYGTGKKKVYTKLTYNTAGKYKLLIRVKYNKFGQKRSIKRSSAYYYKQTYTKKGKLIRTNRYKYKSNGKKTKAKRISRIRF